MTTKKLPLRISYKAKDGTRKDVAVCWESDRYPGLYDVKPHKEHEDGQYPKMPMSEAVALVERGEGFLSLAMPKPKQQSYQAKRDEDTDLPF